MNFQNKIKAFLLTLLSDHKEKKLTSKQELLHLLLFEL